MREVCSLHPSARKNRASLLVIEEQIDIRILTRLAARRRPEQVQMRDAKPPQPGFVFFQYCYGVFALHDNSISDRILNYLKNIYIHSHLISSSTSGCAFDKPVDIAVIEAGRDHLRRRSAPAGDQLVRFSRFDRFVS
jgi:hypothetical protein